MLRTVEIKKVVNRSPSGTPVTSGCITGTYCGYAGVKGHILALDMSYSKSKWLRRIGMRVGVTENKLNLNKEGQN